MDIENLISKNICKYLLKGNTEHNEEIVLYGVQLIVETVFKYCVLLFLAIILRQSLACVIYIALLSRLRANAGGAHCKTNIGCTLMLFLCFLIGVLLNQLEIPLILTIIGCVIAMGVCIRYAPVSTLNNPITDSEVRKRKKIRSIIWLIVCIIVAVFTRYDGYLISVVMSVVVAVIIQKSKQSIKM